MEANLPRALSDLVLGGDLAARESVDVLEHDDRPLSGGEPIQGALQLISHGDTGLGKRRYIVLRKLVARELLRSPAGAQPRDRDVRDDPMHPRLDPRLLAEPLH
jgi:hypothetical protein